VTRSRARSQRPPCALFADISTTVARFGGPMDGTASFGYWIRRRRKALDLTQDELAQRVGCATATIKRIEADERRPSRQMAERLADCLELAGEQRAAFVKAARAELAADRLVTPLETPLTPPRE